MHTEFPLPVNDTYLIFDLHGVLTSKVEMGKQYDEFVAKFLEAQFDMEITKTREAIKLANNEWLSFWAKAKNLSQEDFTKEYEEANATWAKMILQGKKVHDYRQFAEFLEYHVPASLCCIFPEVKAVLQELNQKGIRLILASSANTRHSTGVLVGCKILYLFEKIVGMENTKALKSNIAYYEKILEIIDQPAEKCVFIGNSITEIELPKKLGMKTVHIMREIDYSIQDENQSIAADIVLPDLKELESKLFGKKG